MLDNFRLFSHFLSLVGTEFDIIKNENLVKINTLNEYTIKMIIGVRFTRKKTSKFLAVSLPFLSEICCKVVVFLQYKNLQTDSN